VACLTIAAALFACTGTFAQSANSSSGAPVAVLVELFTSEGCSSCPPADALIQTWDSSQPFSGAQLIILSEHVDYWDHDGWRDPYSLASLTARQSAYALALGNATPYTPQVIVDGKGELQLTDMQQVQRVFQSAIAAAKIPVRIDSVHVQHGTAPLLRAHVAIDAAAATKNADAYIAVALDHAKSNILRGENAGRQLAYIAVVQEVKKIGKVEKGSGFSQDVQFKLNLSLDQAKLRFIVFVQQSGPGTVVGAAMWKSGD
jgi:hypothetical protein